MKGFKKEMNFLDKFIEKLLNLDQLKMIMKSSYEEAKNGDLRIEKGNFMTKMPIYTMIIVLQTLIQ